MRELIDRIDEWLYSVMLAMLKPIAGAWGFVAQKHSRKTFVVYMAWFAYVLFRIIRA